jgi:hypothetical protein
MATSETFSAVDALSMIMSGNDSELSDMSSDEDDLDDIYQPEEQGCTLEGNSSSEEEEGNDGDNGHDEDHNPKSEHVFRWKKTDITFQTVNFEMEKINEERDEKHSALYYFEQFWTEELTNLVVQQTNDYSVQKSGASINTSHSELEQFIGMHIKMGVVNLPSYTHYWSRELRYPSVADVMPRKRFEKLRRYLHFVDNMTYDKDCEDKLFKVRCIVEMVAANCRKVPPEENHSVDEQIIPSKTKYSRIRQYNPKKPVKWGFKNLVRAGSSGFMCDFFIYSGKDSTTEVSEGAQNLQKSAKIVVKLCEALPPNSGHKLYFDNWFTTLDLLLYLQQVGILACGTLRSNRLQKCPLKSNKDLKSAGRGSIDYRSDANSDIIIVKWFDNGPVHLVSNFVGVEPLASVERWSSKDKKRVPIPCPQIVKCYNGGMGGVDLADMFIALYRIVVKTCRWYIKVFWHCIDICKVNAWILYRRHCDEQGIPKKNQKSLLKFSLLLADSLIHVNKVLPPESSNGKPGRPAKRKSIEVACNSKPGRKPVTPSPDEVIRTDQFGHWPVYREKGRCRMCKTGYSKVHCSKCKVCICLTGQRNCFIDFHNGL